MDFINDFTITPIMIMIAVGAVGGLCRTLEWFLSEENKTTDLSMIMVARNLLFGAVGGGLFGTNAMTAFAAGCFFELGAVGIFWDSIIKRGK